jgi:dihydrofolate synthase/folylpolyglutamate synthase
VIETDIAERILSRARFGKGLALHRMLWLTARLPQAARLDPATVIHVTGSNGKGTVTTLTSALLRALGFRAGAFVSPHVSRFEERIMLDGAAASADALGRAYAWFEAKEKAYLSTHSDESFGAFEAVTAVAFHAFAAAQLDALVLEAGIGGRYDVTRAAQGRVAGLISVESEHASILGPSLEHILYDKADIAPPGGCLIAGRLAPALRERLSAYGRLRGVDTLYTDELARIEDATFLPGETRATIRLGDIAIERLRLPTTGRAQLWNAIHALCLGRAFLERRGAIIDGARLADSARKAFAATALPLRFEKTSSEPEIFLDGAHTAGATQTLAETLQECLLGRHVVLVLGLSSDKPAEALAPLLPCAAFVIITRARHRSAAPEAIAAHLRDTRSVAPLCVIEDLETALARAKAEAKAREGVVLVTGAFYLAAEARALLRGEDVTRLKFL